MTIVCLGAAAAPRCLGREHLASNVLPRTSKWSGHPHLILGPRRWRQAGGPAGAPSVLLPWRPRGLGDSLIRLPTNAPQLCLSLPTIEDSSIHDNSMTQGWPASAKLAP